MNRRFPGPLSFSRSRPHPAGGTRDGRGHEHPTRSTERVRNGVDTEILFATLDAVKAQPEIARFQFRATTSLVYVAAARGVRLTDVESSVEGDIDLNGAFGTDPENHRNGFERIRMTFRVKGDAPPEKLREVVRGHKAFCTMSPAATELYAAVTFDEGDGERYGYARIPASADGVRMNGDWDALGMRASGSIGASGAAPERSVMTTTTTTYWIHPQDHVRRRWSGPIGSHPAVAVTATARFA